MPIKSFTKPLGAPAPLTAEIPCYRNARPIAVNPNAPKVCTRCGCADVRTAYGYEILYIDFIDEKVKDDAIYWTHEVDPRKDVLNRVCGGNNSITRVQVSKFPVKEYYSCATNSCHLGEFNLRAVKWV